MTVQGDPTTTHKKHSRYLMAVPGAEMPRGWVCSVLATTSSRQNHRSGRSRDSQRPVNVPSCTDGGWWALSPELRHLSLVPLPVLLLRVGVIQSSSVEIEQEEGTLGSSPGYRQHPLPGGITQPLFARQEESQLAERKNPHLTARGSQQLPDSVGRESLCTLESTWV